MEIKKITDEFYQDKVFRKLKWKNITIPKEAKIIF